MENERREAKAEPICKRITSPNKSGTGGVFSGKLDTNRQGMGAPSAAENALIISQQQYPPNAGITTPSFQEKER